MATKSFTSNQRIERTKYKILETPFVWMSDSPFTLMITFSYDVIRDDGDRNCTFKFLIVWKKKIMLIMFEDLSLKLSQIVIFDSIWKKLFLQCFRFFLLFSIDFKQWKCGVVIDDDMVLSNYSSLYLYNSGPI